MSAEARRTADDVAEPEARASLPPVFLYGDSEPFPHAFDFIATVEGLVELCVAVLSAAAQAKKLSAELAAERGALAQRVGTLDALLQSVAQAVAVPELARGADEGFLSSTVQRLERSAEDACSHARSELERGFESQRAQLDQAYAATLEAMVHATCEFFLGSETDVASESFHAELKETGYSVELTQRLAGEIAVSYEIDAATTAWSTPRRVVDFVGSLSAEVGPRRSWLTRSVSMETRALDEYWIGGVSLEDELAQVRLRKRRDAPDTLTLRFSSFDGAERVQIIRAEEPGAVFEVAEEQAARLARLRQALAARGQMPRTARVKVRALALDGDDALNAQGAERIVTRLVEVYGPIAAEVARRSRSAGELCLKRTLGNGVREERYLERATLVQKLARLPPEDRARLAVLHLTGPRALPAASREARISVPPPPPRAKTDDAELASKPA